MPKKRAARALRPASAGSRGKGAKRGRTPAAKAGAARGTRRDNRGLIVFGAIIGLVVLLAGIGKLRQGPAVKMLPCQVQMVFAMPDQETPLSSPRGMAIDADGNVFITDLGNNRVVKFKADGTLDSTFGDAGTDAGQFKEPSGVAVDGHGAVYVADAWNGRIQKFTTEGEYLGEISAKAGTFYSPRNVGVDGNGFIYVADTGNSCVKKFDADANLIKRWGEFGPGRLRFQETFGLWIDGKNQIYVGDAGNRRVKVFTADGTFVREVRVKGWQTGVSWPMMAVDGDGRLYATDVQQQMVWIYDRAGKYIGCWGNQPGKEIFAAPLGIAVDSSGAVYVANMNHGQILKLAPLPK